MKKNIVTAPVSVYVKKYTLQTLKNPDAPTSTLISPETLLNRPAPKFYRITIVLRLNPIIFV